MAPKPSPESATSITAFVGSCARGPTNKAVSELPSLDDFERKFGNLDWKFSLPFQVSQFFRNGGKESIIVRVTHADAIKSTIDAGGLMLQASGEGKWGDSLRVRIDHQTKGPNVKSLFNLSVFDKTSRRREQILNLSIDPDCARFYKVVLPNESDLIGLRSDGNIDVLPKANEPLEIGF